MRKILISMGAAAAVFIAAAVTIWNGRSPETVEAHAVLKFDNACYEEVTSKMVMKRNELPYRITPELFGEKAGRLGKENVEDMAKKSQKFFEGKKVYYHREHGSRVLIVGDEKEGYTYFIFCNKLEETGS